MILNQKNITTLQDAGFRIEPGRQRRAQTLRVETWNALPDGGFQGAVRSSGRMTVYRPEIRVEQGKIMLSCGCADWKTRGMTHKMPCKHILALAFHVGDIPTVSGEDENAAVSDPEPEKHTTPPEPPFQEKLRQAIGKAIASLADQVHDLMQAGEIPFLLGPTGVGKTSAVRMVAQRQGWDFEEVAGSPSFADSDLVGLRTDHMEVPGVFARAFQRAREGETVLLFIDELTRFNARALDILMRPLQVTPGEIARAMGLAWSDIRLVEAPLWGQDWAPAENVRIVLAANPWGAQLDPALVRRVYPLPTGFSEKVLDLFEEPVKGAIRASWEAVENGQLALPMEYQLLLTAKRPDDASIITPYMHKLRALDPASAEGFEVILDGLGIRAGGAS